MHHRSGGLAVARKITREEAEEEEIVSTSAIDQVNQ